jgi:aldose 1-epimerase
VAGALSRILLRDGPLTVGIAPAWGGALTRFDVRRGAALIPILRPAADHPATAHAAAGLPALSASSFPMLPYCGRLRAGQFEFEGRRYQFPLNAAPERHSSHGDGWSRAWSLTQLDHHSATMSLPADPAAPMPYAATQRVSVQAQRLRVSIGVRNVGADRLPVGLGLHPYFAQRSRATLRADLPRRWRWDQEFMPLKDEPNPQRREFLDARPIAGLPVAAEYAHWDGHASVAWPALGVEVGIATDPPLRHAVLWVPEQQDFFCFEPQSHASDALHAQAGHAAAEDFIILEPQRTFEQHFDFTVAVD